LLSKTLYERFDKEPGFDFGLTEKGILMFYKTEKAAEEEVGVVKKGRELGLEMDILSVAQCKALQPKLELDILGAVYYKCDAHLYPNAFIKNLISNLGSSGVKILRGHEVTKIKTSGQTVTGVVASGREWTADNYVISSGALSPSVAKLVNLNVPMMPGKGYTFMVEEPEERMTIPALLHEARVAITPMNGSIRYGGTMELGKINNKVNMNRVSGIVESISKYFPGLKPEIPAEKDVWFGFRPSSPDGLPYIGRSKKYNNLVIATGHGMMGLSLGPATGLLVSQVIDEIKTGIDIAAFSPNRYQR